MDSLLHSKQDVILEAKRMILKEQIERITDIALSNVNLHSDIKSNAHLSCKENCNQYVSTKLCKCNGLPKWNNHEFWTCIPNPNINGLNKPNVQKNSTVDFVQPLKLYSPPVKSSKKISEIERITHANIYSKKTNILLMRKFFKKWKLHVKAKVEEKNILKEAEQRREKVNKFIKELKKQKRLRKVSKTSALIQNTEVKRDTQQSNYGTIDKYADKESYKSRFLAQKSIIEKQKGELEKKNKIIEDLKLNRITKDIEASVQQTKANLKETLKYCSPQLKSKIASLNVVKDDEQTLLLDINKDIKYSAAPKIVMQMEKRAKERSERRKLILERKRVIDEEKRRMAAEIVEKQKSLDEEEKRKNLNAMKEKRRLEIEAEKVRQANKKIYLDKLKIACDFYCLQLKKGGLRAFRNNLRIRDIRMLEAINVYETNLLLKNFQFWKNYVNMIVSERNGVADRLFAHKSKVKVMVAWKSVLQDRKISVQVADDFYEMCLLRRIFKNWHINICILYNEYVKKKQMADKHYNSRLVIQTFFLWKTLPTVLKLERVKEERKRKWREKVMEVLPNYNPIIDS